MDDRRKSIRTYLANELNRDDTDLRKYSDRSINLKRRATSRLSAPSKRPSREAYNRSAGA